ncbi:MAG: hypothetical protein HYR94_12845, partial [Chloroflexi bacterium]|nr:hypothetical protein [Chloroflexota bacterium]
MSTLTIRLRWLLVPVLVMVMVSGCGFGSAAPEREAESEALRQAEPQAPYGQDTAKAEVAIGGEAAPVEEVPA